MRCSCGEASSLISPLGNIARRMAASERAKIGERSGALGEERKFRGSSRLKRLAHSHAAVSDQRGDVEQFRRREHRCQALPMRASHGSGSASEPKPSPQPARKIGDGFADQLEFGLERGCVLLRCEGIDRAAAGGARRQLADDFLQAVEFEKFSAGRGKWTSRRPCRALSQPRF